MKTSFTLFQKFSFKKSFLLNKPKIAFTPFLMLALYGSVKKLKCESEDLTSVEVIRGEYENKIRSFASIEKRFLLFSKVKKAGEIPTMTYFQFLESIVPFQYMKTKPREEVEELLNKNKHFQDTYSFLDINKDNQINFEEFIIFNVFMTIPLVKFIQKFPSGKITREELSDMLMEEISKGDVGLKITNKSLFDGRLVKTDHDTLFKYMMEFFGKGANQIDINKDIAEFKLDIFIFMLYYEFYRIPGSETNKIPLEKFARVLLSLVNIYKNRTIKTKIDNKEIPLEGEVTFDQYVTFFFILNQLHADMFAIFQDHKKLSFEDLKKLFHEKMRQMPRSKGVKPALNDDQIKLMIDLFDDNRDGVLEFKEIYDILRKRVNYSSSKNDVIYFNV